MKSLLITTLILHISLAALVAQPIAERQVIQINASTNKSLGEIRLTWPLQSTGTNISVYRRGTLETGTWGSPISTLMLSDSSYTDNKIEIGSGYEYRVETSAAIGYIYSGIELKPEHYRSGCILVIDSTFKEPLKNELARFQTDLENESWNVKVIYVSRGESVNDIRSKIVAERSAMANLAEAVILIGQVPVPYSGKFTGTGGGQVPPDGHVEGSGNHTGAWPTDGYYGDMDGNWTDVNVTLTTGNQSRHHNVPGDGKFDQSKFPSEVELQVGRIDMHDLTSFSKSDTQLLRDYFNRNHLWRTGQLGTIERALVDNNFNGLNLASTGFHNFSTFFPFDSISKVDYFGSMKTAPYMWSYGCGAGSYTSCNGVGKTVDFAADSLQSIFTILAGSFFGDWDIKNNLLRASIANSALVSFWGGIPKWYIHSMAMGMNIGQGARASQNNTTNYFNGNFNGSQNGVYIALMGDPTLTMRPFKGPVDLSGVSAENKVTLNWTASADPRVMGYNIYRVGDFRVPTLVNPAPITETSFVDSLNRKTGNIEYAVRAVRLDTTASGTFVNLSGASRTNINHEFNRYLSTNTFDLDHNINIFPNPGRDRMTITMNPDLAKTIQVQIKDVSGRLVSEDQYNKHVQGNSILIEHQLKTGVYFIELIQPQMKVTTQRYIVNH